ncbi:ABC transporter substrate-binding protein [Kineococcus rubinsiae]|uniref:ABC transporter substrate-binding protein n=1 Tax=Kineococcus rubinsiae TaxID=2609562 RepID=UPI00142F9E0C|nr:ABC transporter substrate-binding protein [Kineococcus rubinsiae]NIZ93469.1 ABC transporter substrate-binding protein [Kineococcus rubinsiae]
MSNVSRRTVVAGALGSAVAVGAASCGTAEQEDPATGASSSSSGSAGGSAKVKLQLQWVTQGQFAGYFAALDQGFYTAEGLDVEILEGGSDIVPQTVLAQGQADYAIAWVPKALASREQGAAITNVAQIYQRSGTLQVSFAKAAITAVEGLKGKNVGNWGFGNEFELFAAMTAAGLDPSKDVTLVQQQFDMLGLLQGDIDAAQAMTYNEYAQLLEAEDPATGKLYTPADFTALNWNDVGTAMLQDSIWANSEKLSDPAYQEQTVKFVKASIKGWAYARDNPEAARDIVVAKGSTLGASHQLWQVNEVNKLIWPATAGAGVIDEAAWDKTVAIARDTRNAEGQTVITKDPDDGAHTNEYVLKALEELKAEGVDVTGESFQPATVTLAAGGA